MMTALSDKILPSRTPSTRVGSEAVSVPMILDLSPIIVLMVEAEVVSKLVFFVLNMIYPLCIIFLCLNPAEPSRHTILILFKHKCNIFVNKLSGTF